MGMKLGGKLSEVVPESGGAVTHMQMFCEAKLEMAGLKGVGYGRYGMFFWYYRHNLRLQKRWDARLKRDRVIR